MTVRHFLAALDELYGRDDELADRFVREHADTLKAAQSGQRDAEAPLELTIALAEASR